MKKSIFLAAFTVGSLMCAPAFSQSTPVDSLGLPGDNLNLYGVLNVFQQSPTLEDFEKKLNDPDTKLNNLDLNGDDKADYIKVTDHVEGTSHSIVLQVAVNEKETQDVAVIDVDKDKDGKVNVQIIGDEALYGKDYIVEPSDATAKSGGTPNPGYKGTTQNANNITNNYYSNGSSAPASTTTVIYEPASWGIVHYMYEPTYVVYASPWYWGYYPGWWAPWHPIYFHAYWNVWYHRPYYGYYHRTTFYHDPVYHSYYGPRRSVSVTVTERRSSGAYRATYSHPEMGPRTVRANNRSTGPRSAAAPRGNAGPRSTAAPRSNSAPRSNVAPRSNTAPRSTAAPRSAPAQRSAPSAAPRSSGGGGGHMSGGGGGRSGGGHSGGGGGHRGR